MTRTTMKTSELEVGNSPVEFKVYDGGALLGTLSVSRGGLRWYPRGCSKGRIVEWRRFAWWNRSRRMESET